MISQFIISIFLLLNIYVSSKSHTGTLTYSFYANNQELSGERIGPLKMWLYKDDYLVEEILMLMLEDGKETGKKWSYYVSNLKTKEFAAYNTEFQLLDKGVFEAKKSGDRFVPDNEILGDLSLFYHKKDTVINSKSLRVISNERPNLVGEKIRLYVDTSIKDFPYRFYSQTLQEKFGGLIVRSEFVREKGVSSIRLEFKPSIEKERLSQIKKMIRLSGI